jgi:hypothetical protein
MACPTPQVDGFQTSEPATIVMMSGALAAIFFIRRRF